MMKARELKVKELGPKEKGFNILVKVVSKDAPRQVFSAKTGITYDVVYTVVGDETGVINMSLWGENIRKIKEGDVILIKGAYTGLFNNHLQLNVSKKGKIGKSKKKMIKVNEENNVSARRLQLKYTPSKRRYY